MTTIKLRERWQNLSNTKRQWYILIPLIIAAVVLSVVGLALDCRLAGLFLNLGTELGGAILTFWLLGQLLGKAEQQQELKEQLIRAMGSDVRDVAVPAVEELRAHGWLTDGSLKGAYLGNANLKGAHLEHAKTLREVGA